MITGLCERPVNAARRSTPHSGSSGWGVEAEFWLNLQLAWDLYHAQHSEQAKDRQRIRRLPQLPAGETAA